MVQQLSKSSEENIADLDMPLTGGHETDSDLMKALDDDAYIEIYYRFIQSLAKEFEEDNSSNSYNDFVKSIKFLKDKQFFADESEYIQIFKDATATYVASRFKKRFKKTILGTFKNYVFGGSP